MLQSAVTFGKIAMKILFIGQKGVPAHTYNDSDEKRVEILAGLLAAAGHEVAVTCSASYAKSRFRTFAGAKLIYPYVRNESGWLQALTGIVSLWRLRPDVIHVHSWPVALLIWLAPFLPKATYLWTISSLPRKSSKSVRYLARRAAHAFDVITTPSRYVQYGLFHTYGLIARYLPDGYLTSNLAPIPAAHWNLRKGQYVVAFASDNQEAKHLIELHTSSQTKKKMVLVGAGPSGKYKPSNRNVKIITDNGERALISLIQHSSAVIVGRSAKHRAFLLCAMAAGKPILAVNAPLHTEALGAAGILVSALQGEDARAYLQLLTTHNHTQKQLAAAAQKRARKHFQWKRLLKEYEQLYHYPQALRIPIDSAISRSSLARQTT